jgi:hypothetical protein
LTETGWIRLIRRARLRGPPHRARRVRRATNRVGFLEAAAARWRELDAREYPFTRSVAAHLPGHDDRGELLAGIDLILAGIAGSR